MKENQKTSTRNQLDLETLQISINFAQNLPQAFAALVPTQELVVVYLFIFLCAGWINIDCGALKDYTDPVTKILWVTDAGYINTGVNLEVPNALNVWKGYSELATVRAFNTSGAKNCYSLGPLTPNGTYTVRGTFLYDYYDNAATLPTFQVAIGTTVVANVSFANQYNLRYLEFTLMATSNTIHYCLLQDQSLSTPFISALTVRPISQAQVDEWFTNTKPSELSRGYIFKTKRRLDFGGQRVLRYVDCLTLIAFLILRY